jgi:hypothetical protein
MSGIFGLGIVLRVDRLICMHFLMPLSSKIRINGELSDGFDMYVLRMVVYIPAFIILGPVPEHCAA